MLPLLPFWRDPRCPPERNPARPGHTLTRLRSDTMVGFRSLLAAAFPRSR